MYGLINTGMSKSMSTFMQQNEQILSFRRLWRKKNTMTDQRVLAVITARGGSKRVPRKNLRRLGNQSLLERTVRASKGSTIVDRTVLSSDCPKIAKEALKCGCDVPFTRPFELATDGAQSEDVLIHAINNLPFFDWVVLLQPSSPFRTSEDIDLAFEVTTKLNRNSCVGVTPFQSNNDIDQKYFFNGEVFISNTQKHEAFVRSGGEIFILNGAIYLIKMSHFLHTKKLVDADTIGIQMSTKKSLDIDTFEDLQLAAKLMEV